jgi:hypothetical protein
MHKVWKRRTGETAWQCGGGRRGRRLGLTGLAVVRHFQQTGPQRCRRATVFARRSLTPMSVRSPARGRGPTWLLRQPLRFIPDFGGRPFYVGKSFRALVVMACDHEIIRCRRRCGRDGRSGSRRDLQHAVTSAVCRVHACQRPFARDGCRIQHPSLFRTRRRETSAEGSI